MRSPSWSVRFVVLVAVLLVAGAGSTAATGHVDGKTAPSKQSLDFPPTQQETPAATNNTSVRHENPDEVDESGNLDAVQRHLSSQLAERLGNSTLQLSQGEYETAKSLLGDEYYDTLKTLAEEQGGGSSNTSQAFSRALEDQREFASALESYNETEQEYREAKRNGNETRARELARELARISDRVNRTGKNVTRGFHSLENETGTNLNDSIRQVETVQTNISEQQTTIQQAEFQQTRLSVSAPRENVSFSNPLPISGRLLTENGTPVADQRVTIRVGERNLTTRTSAEGRFTVSYRPVLSPVTTDAVEVRYLPDDVSVYWRSNATLPVTVDGTRARFSLENVDTSVAFGERVRVTGRLTANGTGVPTMPVRATVGGVVLNTTSTAADGSFTLLAPFPADVPAGNATLRVSVPTEGRAVTANTTNRRVRVVETKTALSVTVAQDRSADGTLTVEGRLETTDGRSLANRSLSLRLNGTTISTVETGKNGTFNASIPLPPQSKSARSVSVAVVYDEPGSNLAASRARDSVVLERSTEGFSLPVPPIVAGSGVALLVALLGIGLVVRSGEEGETDTSPGESDSTTEPSSTGPATEERLLSTARDLAAGGDADGAIETAYAAVRDALRTGHGPEGETHWEFVTAVEGGLSDDDAAALRDLTETYEASVYAPRAVGDEDVERALALASDLVSRE